MATPGAARRRRLVILGSTGSIGRQTLAVVEHLDALAARGEDVVAYEVVGLSAGSNAARLLEQAGAFGVSELALAEGAGVVAGDGATLRVGVDAAERLVREVEADVVVCAIVGVAGLAATLAAVELGRDAALANKEALVAAGGLVVGACARSGAKLLPVDSEHAALWMCLASGADGFVFPPHGCPGDLDRAVLTASGGALRGWDAARLERATAADALAHPNWSMGAKVTIDTATLINKSFELVEAHWLFGIPGERLGIVVHPQSLVHAVAEWRDGSSVAHLGAPDMRTPILGALTAPGRPAGCVRALSLVEAGSLTFEEADADRFPGVGLGHAIVERGGTAGAIVNGANEAAVSLFAEGAIAFPEIARLSWAAIDAVGVSGIRGLDDVMEADGAARAFVARECAVGGGGGALGARG